MIIKQKLRATDWMEVFGYEVDQEKQAAMP